MNIEGLWTGEIIYGKEYIEHAGHSLFFDLEIFQNGNKIQGNAIDTSGVGISPDAATIAGNVAGTNIKFTKRYKSYHYYENGHTKIDRTRQGPKIKYAGCFDPKDQVFKGNWVLKGWTKLFGFIPMQFKCTGRGQ